MDVIVAVNSLWTWRLYEALFDVFSRDLIPDCLS